MTVENTSLVEREPRSIVFIHSGFRTSSTWLWSKFRERRNVLAYNEIFHEEIENFTCSNVYNIKPAAWNSRHPPSTPYFLEYLPLIKPSGGVDFYKKNMAFEKYIPEDGLTGKLSSPEIDYVGGLISHAYNTNKIPLLCCTRTLGRISALRDAFGGKHILLVRNLFNQWQSYCYQREVGNDYFLSTILKIDENFHKDNFFRFIHEYISSKYSNDFSLDSIDIDDLFLVFLMQNVYLTVNAAEIVDYIFDVSAVAESARDHLDYVSKDLYDLTGILVDLHDVKIDDSPSSFYLRDIDSVELVAYMFLDVALAELSATENQALFGKKLLADTFVLYRRLAPLARRASEVAEALKAIEVQLSTENLTQQETHRAWAAEHERSGKLEESVRYLQSGLENEKAAHRSTHGAWTAELRRSEDLEESLQRLQSELEREKAAHSSTRDAWSAEREQSGKLEESLQRLRSELENEKATHRSTHDAWSAEHGRSEKLNESLQRLQSELEGEKATHRLTHDAWSAEHGRSEKLEKAFQRLQEELERESASHQATRAAWVDERSRSEGLEKDNAQLVESYEGEKIARRQIEEALASEEARAVASLAEQSNLLGRQEELSAALELSRVDLEKSANEREALKAAEQLAMDRLAQVGRELQAERLRREAMEEELSSERTAVQYFEKEVQRLRALVATSPDADR